MSPAPHPLRAARLRAGLTQAQLAQRAGVSRATINYIEKGQLPQLRTLLKVARSLGVDARELIV